MSTRESDRTPGGAFDPRATPISRRRVLVAFGAGTLAAGGGLGVILGACNAPPVTIRLDVTPAALPPGVPTLVPFTLSRDGASVAGSTWLVRNAAETVTAFDPRCTHALCAYDWSAETRRFACRCHPGFFGIDGAVLSGPPPRPLDRFATRVTGDVIEVDVPASFTTPRESLPG